MSIYRNRNLIDVNQNDALLSSSYRISGEQKINELQEQIKSYKNEITKRDELISKLSTSSPRSESNTRDNNLDDTSLIDSPCSAKAKSFDLDSPDAELAAAKKKIENISTENRELLAKLETKDNFIQDLRSNIQLLQENDARQLVVIQSLKDELKNSKRKSEVLEQITNKGTITIEALQCEHRQAVDRIVDFEAKVRELRLTNEEFQLEAESFKRKYNDFILQLSEPFKIDVDGKDDDDTLNAFVTSIKNLSQEKLVLESRVRTLDDALNAHSLETKASRETIMRLVSEVGKEQKNKVEINNTVAKLHQERDEINREKESLQRELNLVKSRLEANDKTWTSSREELSQTATKVTMLSEDVRRLEAEKSRLRNDHGLFCEEMAKILKDLYVDASPTEDSIKQRIRQLLFDDAQKNKKIEELEAKIENLSSELNQQFEFGQESARRVKSFETSIYQKENRLKDLEDEIASGEVVRDTLRRDKTKYLSFLQELAEAMKMEEVAADLGYDFNTDVLIARAHQLAKLESDALIEKTSSNYNLQRKVKSMKEEVKSKELHMELLRKKIDQLEEKAKTRNGIALDRDDAIVTAQRLQRKVERLQHALGDERVKVNRLKVEMAETNKLKEITFEQRKKIDELVNSMGRLSSTKEKQRQKLNSLKRNLSANEFNADERIIGLESQLKAVTKELNSTKVNLDEVSRREKQLVDFREMVARVLGMEMSNLSVPDYEVMSRLEKLIRYQQIGGGLASTPVDGPMIATNSRFRTGYETPVNHSPSRYHSPTPPISSKDSDSSTGPKRHYRRSRSSSPKRY